MSELHEDYLSECCSAPYWSVCSEDLGDIGTCHAECSKCEKPCNLKPKTLGIDVHDEIRMKDVPHG